MHELRSGLAVWMVALAGVAVLGCSEGTTDPGSGGAGDATADLPFAELPNFFDVPKADLQVSETAGQTDVNTATDGAAGSDSASTDDAANIDDTATTDDTAAQSDAQGESDVASVLDTGGSPDAAAPDDADTDETASGDAAAQTDAGELPDANDTGAQTDSMAATDAVLTTPGEFGAPCTTGTDCLSNYCVESPQGMICTKTCTASCPDGWQCAAVPSGSDVAYICLNKFARLCDPCSQNSDCNAAGAVANRCIETPGGNFCGVVCQLGKDNVCPEGYQCVSSLSGGAQCQPQGGQCTCSPAAIAKGLSTNCSKTSAPGTCAGKRTCGPAGLSACDAPVPAYEVCNLVDDDCDGTTDDIPAESCERSNEFGTCKGSATTCADGKPVCGAKEPAPELCNKQDDDCDGQTDEGLCEDGNPCTFNFCNSDGSCGLTNLIAACSDGDVCTVGDECAEGLCKGGPPIDCLDDDPCTIDSCNALGGCVHLPSDGTCTDDGNACTDDRCISGVCQHKLSGVGTPCPDDGNSCTLDQCNGGLCAHPPMPSGTACADDGLPCTNDVCEASKCTHPAVAGGTPCPDDGLLCTDDLCDGGGDCKHTLQSSACLIGGLCVTAGDSPPGQPCLACNPLLATDQFVAALNKTCDDDNDCTVDDLCTQDATCAGKAKDCSALSGECAVGTCDPASGTCASANKPAGSTCTDNEPCTTQDECQNGQCKGKAIDCSVLNGPCQTGVCTGGLCLASAKPATTPCDDGNACTVEDKCDSNGGCKSVAKDCSSLTTQCSNGQCQAGNCVAVAKPGSEGTLCNDGDQCTFNDVCKSGQCGGVAPLDAYEPNNSAPGAGLSGKSDCDDTAANTSASISPGTDNDWYSYYASDDTFCSIYPSVRLTSLTTDYDLCVYFKCNGSSSGSEGSVTCDSGVKVSGGPYGTWGCCSTNAGTQDEYVSMNNECSFLGAGDDGGDMYVHVYKKNSQAICSNYVLRWSATGNP